MRSSKDIALLSGSFGRIEGMVAMIETAGR